MDEDLEKAKAGMKSAVLGLKMLAVGAALKGLELTKVEAFVAFCSMLATLRADMELDKFTMRELVLEIMEEAAESYEKFVEGKIAEPDVGMFQRFVELVEKEVGR